MLLIGSQALRFHMPVARPSNDYDIIVKPSRLPELINFMGPSTKMIPVDANHLGLQTKTCGITETLDIELAWPGTTAAALLDMAPVEMWDVIWFDTKAGRLEAYLPPLEILYQIKMAHRYKKDSPHFAKTMNDILAMRQYDSALYSKSFMNDLWFKQREQESYGYRHPNLKRTKAEFFSNDSVAYKYDHDTLHLAVKHQHHPAYYYFSTPGQEVLSSREQFEGLGTWIQQHAVLEESYVLALERSQIPFDFKPAREFSFNLALEKVCTSITSGWFREYAWENYHTIKALYNDDYVDRFHAALAEGIVKDFKA